VVSTLTKKMFRDLRDHWPQFLAVTLVILSGITALGTSRGSVQSLKASRDSYYSRYGMADMWVYVEKAPDNAVRKFGRLDGISRTRGRIVFDVPVDIAEGEETITGRIVSMPNPRDSSGKVSRTGLLDIHIEKGSYFTSSSEAQVIINAKFAEARSLSVGSEFQATLNDSKERLKVVGIARSPEYIYTIQSAQDFFPNPKNFGILWVPRDFAEQALDFQGASNNLIVALDKDADATDLINKAEKIFSAYGYMWALERDDNISHRMVTDEITGNEASANITPSIFLAVAAVVIMIMLSRLVKNQRTEVGTLMALGYTRFRLVLHYLSFSMVVGILGTAGGLMLGYYFAGLIASLYRQFYSFPELVVKADPDVIIIGFVFGMSFSLGGGLVAIRSLLRLTPAAALRPKPPAMGKRILLERIGFLWRMLPFRWKMISRNLGRHKIRASFAVLGIVLSATILIIGFMTFDALDYLIEHQFKRVQKEDVRINFSDEKTALACRELEDLPYVHDAEPILEVPVELRKDWRKKSLAIAGLRRNSKMRHVLDVERGRVEVPENGIMIGKRVSETLSVKLGDVLEIKPLIGKKKEKQVTVTGIVEGYFGLLAFMEIGSLSQLLGEQEVANGALLAVERGSIQNLETTVKDYPAVASIQPKARQIKAFEETIQSSMYISTITLLVFAGLISFSIIFTMTTVSISERQRELASLRVIGLSASEVAGIVFNENLLIAFVGIGLGIPVGVLTGKMIFGLYNTDLYRFPSIIYPLSIFIAAIVAFIFVLIANWFSYRKIEKLDMVQVLKTRE
jgi:putative ABC transport system permease protein